MKIDLKSYRFSARVDWIKVSAKVGAHLTKEEIKEMLKVEAYVRIVEGGDNQPYIQVEITFQDPETWRSVKSAVDRISPIELCVKGIEVALDAFSRSTLADESELAALCAYMHRGLPTNLRNPRFIGAAKKEVAYPKTYGECVERFKEGCTLYLGDRYSDHMQRMYVKKTDMNGKIKLPRSKFRARMENTYRGDNLPGVMSGSLRELVQTGHHSLLKAAPTGKPFVDDILENAVRLGTRGKRRTARGYRLLPGGTEADTEFNSRSQDAMRRLAARWAAPAISENPVLVSAVAIVTS